MYKNYSLENVEQYLEIAANTGVNLGLVGAHGRGKTAFISSYAKNHGYELITILLGRMVPEDFIGLPMRDGNKTVYTSPDWILKASEERCLIFFDEFNNAEKDVQAAILDLIQSREANGVKLRDDTQIVMAFNPNSIAPNARNLSKATRDRMCVIPLSDDDEPYHKYFAENGMGALAFALDNTPKLVPSYNNENVECALYNAEPTYRSLENVYHICEFCYDNGIKRDYAYDLSVGCIGKSGASVVDQVFDYFDTMGGKNEKEYFSDLFSDKDMKNKNRSQLIQTVGCMIDEGAMMGNNEAFFKALKRSMSDENGCLGDKKDLFLSVVENFTNGDYALSLL